MMMASAVGIGGSVLAAQPFLGNTCALPGGGCFSLRCGNRFLIAAIGAHCFLVHLARTTVGFTAVACSTQQLDVGTVVGASTREGCDMVKLKVDRTTTTLAYAAITGKYHLLCGFRYVTALCKAAERSKQ
jgi:hypothetical protein